MKTAADIPLCQYDAEGKIVPIGEETEEDAALREAKILYATGQSGNHPDEVFPPAEEPPVGDDPNVDGETEQEEVEGTENYNQRGRGSRRRNRETAEE